MVIKLTIAVHILLMGKLTPLSVEEISLPQYMNSSTNFEGSLFNEEMPRPKPMNLFLSEFVKKPMSLDAFGRLSSKDVVLAGMFERSA